MHTPHLKSAAILSIGTEITRGEIVDTNTQWLSEQLTLLGFDVVYQLSCDDNLLRIGELLSFLSKHCDFIVATGGLGPTTDDLTSEAVAHYIGVSLLRNAEALTQVQERFARLGRTMSPSNEKQADFPSGAQIIKNDQGSAPGFFINFNPTQAFFLPGVPREMKPMFENFVRPTLTPFARRQSHQIVLHSFGLPESVVGEKLSGIEASHTGIILGYRAHFPEIQVKVLAHAESEASAKTLAKEVAEQVQQKLHPYVFGIGNTTLVGAVAQILREQQFTLAVAESCTGGLVGHLFTSEPASDYFLLDVISYSNQAKIDLLDVDAKLIDQYGAVSSQVAEAMAMGARERAGASIGLSLTGIAGPSGGSPEKPVGLVYLGLSTSAQTQSRKINWPGERGMIQHIAAYSALDFLRRELLHRQTQ